MKGRGGGPDWLPQILIQLKTGWTSEEYFFKNRLIDIERMKFVMEKSAKINKVGNQVPPRQSI